MKKFLAVVTALVILAISAIPAFAATNVNEYEKQVLDAINSGVKIGAGTLDISRYYNQAYNYFVSNDKLDSQEKVDAILKAKTDLVSALESYNVGVEADGEHFDLTNVTATGEEIRGAALKVIEPIAKAYDISVSYNPKTDILSLSWDDGKLTSEDLIKQTGSESMVAPIIVAASVVVVLVAAAVVIVKKPKRAAN